MTSINRIAENYEMTLSGRELQKKGDTDVWVQTGKSIAGNSFIRLSGALLRSFADESNLISDKTIDDFRLQFMDAFNKASATIMRDRSIAETNHRNILKIFKDRMWNVGDIITNTKGNMKSIFDREDPNNDPLGQPLGGRR